jgi:hypothetical protein
MNTKETSEIRKLTTAELELISGGITFTSVSNVLKTRHDTSKNSISNVR